MENQDEASPVLPQAQVLNLVAHPKPLQRERNMKMAWKKWISSYQWWAKAAKVHRQDPEDQVAIFMSAIGPDFEDVLESFKLSEEDQKDVEKIKKKFEQYFTPKANDLYEGFLLRQIVQSEEEEFHEYLTKLTVQANKCNYKDTDRMILEQLVIGVRWEKMKERILSTPGITLHQAADICLAYEIALAQKEKIIKADKREAKVEAKVDAVRSEMQKEKTEELDCEYCGRKHAPRRLTRYPPGFPVLKLVECAD